MHDARALIDMGDEAVRRLARRGYTLDLSLLENLQSRRNQSIRTADELRAESKKVAAEVQKAAKAGDVSALKDPLASSRSSSARSKPSKSRSKPSCETSCSASRTCHSTSLPDGDSEDFAVEVRATGQRAELLLRAQGPRRSRRRHGHPRLRPRHQALRPPLHVARGLGAALERALATFFLDLHTQRHGYMEYSVPFLVTRKTMTGHRPATQVRGGPFCHRRRRARAIPDPHRRSSAYQPLRRRDHPRLRAALGPHRTHRMLPLRSWLVRPRHPRAHPAAPVLQGRDGSHLCGR